MFGLENPTFLAKSDIFIPKCTEGGEGGGGIHWFKNYSANFFFSASLREAFKNV